MRRTWLSQISQRRGKIPTTLGDHSLVDLIAVCSNDRGSSTPPIVDSCPALQSDHSRIFGHLGSFVSCRPFGALFKPVPTETLFGTHFLIFLNFRIFLTRFLPRHLFGALFDLFVLSYLSGAVPTETLFGTRFGPVPTETRFVVVFEYF